MKFRINVYGNWCSGYFWELVGTRTGKAIYSCGPYHQSNGREIAFEDAVEYARQHDLSLINEQSPAIA